MNRLLFFFLFGTFDFTQAQSTSNKIIPPDLHKTCLLIEKIDSIGPRCRQGNLLVYCNESEKLRDKQLSALVKNQEIIFRNYKFDYLIIIPEAFPYQEHADLKDLHKYRYILKMHILESAADKKEDLKWMYYFYDRKTGTAYPRLTEIIDSKFKYLKEAVNKFNEPGRPTVYK